MTTTANAENHEGETHKDPAEPTAIEFIMLSVFIVLSVSCIFIAAFFNAGWVW